ncbi:hypothetical protein APH_0358 [Anaplasma phagocytophilum str. HZ]|uniref:Uncharacterized protein n=1 Tax=Anaplasma phagocytophilum (strain HZ) TaxID=212042 RepID=Q2GKY6_ANAPZ|nr:hypothetical protein APH_0358 [Anaplasma phagocytophilum str. HZ]
MVFKKSNASGIFIDASSCYVKSRDYIVLLRKIISVP